MRIAGIIYIILSLTANFIYDHFFVFVLAIFSFPVLIALLLQKKKLSTRNSSVEHEQKNGSISY